jgi:hypothetical protein
MNELLTTHIQVYPLIDINPLIHTHTTHAPRTHNTHPFLAVSCSPTLFFSIAPGRKEGREKKEGKKEAHSFPLSFFNISLLFSYLHHIDD